MSRTTDWRVLGAVALAVVLIASTRPVLSERVERVKERNDVYALPPTEYLPALSFGFRSALADLIWSHVLVTQGLRFGDRRRFEHVNLYLQAINELDPKFREPYRLADSLLTLQAGGPATEANVLDARAILERGLREFPFDTQLWINYGEFLAYVAPGVFKDEEVGKRWRVEGARALVHAGDLGGGRSDTQLWHAVSGVGILTKEGEQEAMIRFLERIYSATEDEELRTYVEKRLALLLQGKQESRALAVTREFDRVWRRDLPFISRTALRVVGPRVDPWRCSGPRDTNLSGVDPCSRNWSDWARTIVPGGN